MPNQKKLRKTSTYEPDSIGFISLEKATKYCDYSQEYLSLRARQGKLKAVKIRRDWVTKRDWIEEYLQRVRKHKRKIDKKNDRIAKKATAHKRRFQKLLKKKKKRRWFSKENLKFLFFPHHKSPSS